MTDNLLINPGFEAEWGNEQNRDTWVCRDDAPPEP